MPRSYKDKIMKIIDKAFGHPNVTLRKTTYYSIVSGLGALITFSFTFVFTEWLGLWYMASLAIASIASFVTKFVLNAIWTFK